MLRRFGQRAGAATVALVVGVMSLTARRARADGGDGVYGRLDSDMVLSAGLSGGIALGTGGVGTLDLRARYLDTAGLVLAASYDADERVVLVTAVEIRPLFLARFLKDQFSGRRFWDLTFDSLGLELGVATQLNDGAGVGLALGAGLELPVAVGDDADGLWLRLGVRHLALSGRYQSGPDHGESSTQLLAGIVLRGSANWGLAL